MSRPLDHIYDLTAEQFMLDNSTAARMDKVFADSRDLTRVKTYQASMNDEQGWYNLSEARLLVEYRAMEDDADATFLTAPTAAFQNGYMIPDVWGVFSQVRLKLNQQSIAVANEPNTQHHLWSAVTMSADYALNQAKNTGWYPMTVPDTNQSQYKPLTPGSTADASTLPTGVAPAVGLQLFAPAHDHAGIVSLPMTTFDDSGTLKFTRTGTSPGNVLRNPLFDQNFIENVRKHSSTSNNGFVTVMLPLKHLFPGLGSIAGHVTRGARLEIEAVRNHISNAEFYMHPFVDDVEVPMSQVKRFELWVPCYEPSDETEIMIKQRLLELQSLPTPLPKVMQDLDLQRFANIPKTNLRNTIKLSTDSAKVLYCFVGFQDTRKRTLETHNPLQFENIGNLGSLSVVVNGMRYPQFPYQSNDKPRQLNDLYEIARKVGRKDSGSLITATNFDSPFRIYAFDFTSQYDPDETKQVSEIEIDYFLQSEPEENYDVVVLLVQEKVLHLHAGQGKTLIR